MPNQLIIPKPDASEYPEWFAHEIVPVPYDDLFFGLEDSLSKTLNVLKNLSPEDLAYRYAPGKWSIKQIWQHIIDVERIMNYRALRYARQDETVLSRFDQNQYAEVSRADERDWENVLAEFAVVRRASLELFKSFAAEMLDHRGTAGKSNMTVRAVGYLILGHELHHLNIIRERYLNR